MLSAARCSRRKAAEAGVVYSLAFGDQPALICDLVDWARTCGFPVVAAGRGHKWLPHFSESTPETVWGYYGLTPEQAERGGLNPKMFNSFLDGSKPSIESTAVANATGLTVPSNGLLYPPASVEDIPFVTRPISEGGVLERKGMVEVISSLEANGRKIPYDIRMGVWVTVEGETEYIRNCFEEYNAHTDPSGRYFTLYKRWHLIGLEVGMSVASVALRGEATGVATCWNADVVATAKRDLKPGELLDGEGGYTVWGKLLPAETSMRLGGLPLGLAHDVKVDAGGEEGPEPVVVRRGDGHLDVGVQDPARDGVAVRGAAPEDGVIDLVFRDALVVDGSGAEPYAATSPSTRPHRRASARTSTSTPAHGRRRRPRADARHHRQPHPLRRADHLGPDAVALARARRDDGGDRQLRLHDRAVPAGRPRADDEEPHPGRRHVDRRAARRHRLGLRDLRRVHGATAQARQRRQRRRLRRPLLACAPT